MTNRVLGSSPIPVLSAAQWQEDLDIFAKELTRRHKNPYHLISREMFEETVAALDAQIPSLTDYEVIVGIERLAAMIGDGHTRLGTQHLYHFLPLETFWFGKELRILRTSPNYRQALGARLVKIGDFTMHKVHGRLQALIPQGENRWYVLNQSAGHIVRMEPLAALGILPSIDQALCTFQDDAGKQFQLQIASLPPNTAVEWIDVVATPPLYLQRQDESFWFTELPNAQTVYVCFRSYQKLAERAKELWSFVALHTPQRLVVDMRQNGGGNYILVRDHLVHKVQFHPTLNRNGSLFVITGRKTFSAAMTNVTDFRRETDAIVVGEPTGARPNGYQELSQFMLPNSGLEVSCSILRYRFQDRNTPAVLPDQRIDPDWRAYRAGRDPIMEWILDQPLK
jgi:hypothetical protein